MAYTTPTTITAAELITVNKLNTQWIDNVSFLANPSAARVRRTAALSHTSNAAWQTVSFDTELYDTNGLWAVGSPSLFTVPVAGLYLCQLHIAFMANATSVRGAGFRVNGVGNISDSGYSLKNNNGASFATPLLHVATLKLSAGNTVEAMAYQASGGSLGYDLSEGAGWFAATWLGLG